MNMEAALKFQKCLISTLSLLCLFASVPFSFAEKLAPSVVHRDEINSLRDKAIESAQKRDYEEAIKFYRRWAELDPENPLVLKDLMWSCWQHDRAEEAGAAARAIIKLRPGNLDALDMLARVPTPENRAAMEQAWRHAVKSGAAEDAPGLALYRKLLALAPENKAFSLLSHFCSGLNHTGQYIEGLEVARYLVKRQPNNPDAWNWLGRAQYASGHNGAAIKSYETSLKLKPGNPLVLKSLMRALWRHERADQAGAIARALIKLRPGDPDALDMLARVPTTENRAAMEWIWRYAVKAGAVKYTPGLALYRKLLALVPENKVFALISHFCSGLNRTGQHREGLEVARYLVKRQPNNHEAWNWLGREQYAGGHLEPAIKSYETSLKIKPDQPLVSIQILRLYFDLRDFSEAARIAVALKQAGNLPDSARRRMAHSLFWAMRYKEALPLLEKAVRSAPEVMNNHYYEALTLFMLGREDAALAKMRAIYDRFKARPAMVFLMDYARMRGDTADEIAILEKECAVLKPGQEETVRRLSGLYDKTGEPERGEELLARFNSAVPDRPDILLMLSEAALKKGNLDASLQFCKQALALNPSSEDIIEELAEIERKVGQVEDSLNHMSELFELNPTDPSNVLNLAQTAYEAKRPQAARKVLTDWLNKNKNTEVLTVLLYHGLTTKPDDPILANTYHHSVEILDSQLKALRGAGYTSVTQKQVNDWLSGTADLPAKSVLITFDDARRDSFLLGDPILKKHGMNAVMFATLINSLDLRSPPGYLHTFSLKKYQDTGRWEIQSHGNHAHTSVRTSSGEDEGLFLINRRWLEKPGRLETVAEWRDRIDKDYLSSRRVLEAALGREVTAFAFPHGAFGQGTDACNVPEAALTNQTLVRKYFKAAYTQDAFGMNNRTRDPGHLTRLEPDQGWTGDELLRYLANNSPHARIYKELLKWAYWENRQREAYKWLAELQKLGVSQGELLLSEAGIHLASNNIATGLRLARRAADLEKIPAAVQIAGSGFFEETLAWSPSAGYDTDNMGRSNWTAGQTLEVARAGPVIWAVRQKYGQYRQRGFDTGRDNAGGAAAVVSMGLFQEVRAELLAHRISGGGANSWSAKASLRSVWTDHFSTQLGFGRALYNTAGAVRENISVLNSDASADLILDAEGLWRASLSGALNSLSDANRRVAFRSEISRAIPGAYWLRGIYCYAYDDMKDYRTDMYYSPRGVTSNALGAELSLLERGQVSWTLRYMPALTSERGERQIIDHGIETSLIWRAGRWFYIRPTYSRFSTPGYIGNSYSLETEVRF